jgi:hypothetical protein
VIVFHCPNANLNVQHLLDDHSRRSDEIYESILCSACIRLHFVNKETGKLLSIQNDPKLA